MSADFWAAIETQLHLLRSKGTTADLVCAILPPIANLATSDADGFFAGSGGDVAVSEVLRENGWSTVWTRASYHWCMQAPDGSQITYVEGDLYKGNRSS